MVEPGRNPACVRAGSASGDAVVHLIQGRAVFCTSVANVRAERQDAGVKLALAQQCSAGQGAKGSAIIHKPQMLRPGLLAPRLQGIGEDHGKADVAALPKPVQAVPNLPAVVAHVAFPYLSLLQQRNMDRRSGNAEVP
jgi:hypothetical protein